MKITIPEDISDVTLDKYQKYSKLIERTDINDFEMNKRLVSLFCDIPYRKMDYVDSKDFAGLVEDIRTAINKDAKFVDRFTLNNIEYGFIPNFDKLTAKAKKTSEDKEELATLKTVMKEYRVQASAIQEEAFHYFEKLLDQSLVPT